MMQKYERKLSIVFFWVMITLCFLAFSVHGKSSLVGVLPEALRQTGPGGAGASLQKKRRLDQRRCVPDPQHY